MTKEASGMSAGHVRHEILIDPLVKAADVADDRPRQRGEIRRNGRRRIAAGERLKADAGREQVHALANNETRVRAAAPT